jgi:hypothetical protein
MTALTLYSIDLLSKWGFCDGDIMLDYLADETGMIHTDYKEILQKVVIEYLIKPLMKHHKIEYTKISTSHNPIRATEVDGVDMTIYWYDINREGLFKIDKVMVTLEQVKELL